MSEKYDRQIRLWASNGQKRLQDAHVCLLNCTSVGGEILKNLVLPGIGKYTVVDGDSVQESHLDGNFFYNKSSMGQNKAAAMCAALQLLNPDVQGHFIGESVENLATDFGAFCEPFSAVVLSGHVAAPVLESLKQVLWSQGTPLVVVNTLGFYGTVRVHISESTIIETHDPSKIYDLRLDQPWPELRSYADQFDMEAMDATDHAHVPYLVIFLKAIDRWLESHAELPSEYSQKRRFKSDYIQAMSRDPGQEANFLEAASNVHRAYQKTHVPSSVKRLFLRPEAGKPNAKTPVFWLLIHTLRNFTELYGALPLPGTLPDMTATTADYVRLQEIYRQKAQQDQQRFTELLEQTCLAAGQSQPSPAVVAAFCRNSGVVHVAWGSMQDYSTTMVEELSTVMKSDRSSELVVYFAILAYWRWVDSGKAGDFSDYAQHFAFSKEPIGPVVQKTLQEVFSHATSSYHNTCSLVGGVAAQEVLKHVTCQYIPLDNLFIYDGIRSSSARWKVSDS